MLAHLDHLASLGVGTIYLTPFFPATSNHRYDASTFARVDPLLGGDEAMARLAAGDLSGRTPGHPAVRHLTGVQREQGRQRRTGRGRR